MFLTSTAQKPPGSLGEHRKPEGEQEVFQHLDISRRGPALDLTLTRDVADVEHRRMGKADSLQESGELADIAGQAC